MEPVSVVFKGLVMWWMVGTPGLVLIPRATSLPEPHYATITVHKSDISGGTCPDGFDSDGDTCTLDLNKNYGNGGLHILTSTGSASSPPNLSAVPLLIGTPNIVELTKNYQPPNGPGNAAWMTLTSGTINSYMEDCHPKTKGNCPRYTVWSVSGGDSNVELLFENASGLVTTCLTLNPGACVLIANVVKANDKMPAPTHHHQGKDHLSYDSGWCLYYKMVEQMPGQSEAISRRRAGAGTSGGEDCPPPAIPPSAPIGPSCSTVEPPPLMDTIACSNSQYP